MIEEDWLNNKISLQEFCRKYKIPLKKILKEEMK